MRKNLLLFLPVLALVAGAVIFTSCGGDDAVPAPTASFTYTSDGRDVTFTSTSTNATTYAWDFGDGKTSTEQNPTHTYDVFGKYTVKLAVTGESGSATSLPDELTLAKSSKVVLDGAFADWADVPDAIVSSGDEGKSIKKIKVDYDALNIYFYVEGTSALKGFFDVYIDSDADTATGYFSGWYGRSFGADYLSEGDFGVRKNAQLFEYNKVNNNTDWTWTTKQKWNNTVIKYASIGTNGGNKAVEFAFPRAAFTNLSEKGFAFAIVDVDGAVDDTPEVATATWATLGALPVPDLATSRLQFFDLTK